MEACYIVTCHTRAFCSDCKADRLFEKEGTSNLLHLVLSIMTYGTWLVVWLLCGALNAFKPFRCTVCGKAILR
jgi:hypothetical protein